MLNFSCIEVKIFICKVYCLSQVFSLPLALVKTAKKPLLQMDNRYAIRGVSATKEEVHNAIKNIDKGLFPQAFCKIIPDHLGGDSEYCLVMHADGAGTKSSLAYMYWKETGDLSVWKGIAQDALIMNIDDLLCVGITDHILFFFADNLLGKSSK